MSDLINDLRNTFKGYHITIDIYPSGGRIEFFGCEECGTKPEIYESAAWKDSLPTNTIEKAIEKLKIKYNSLTERIKR